MMARGDFEKLCRSYSPGLSTEVLGNIWRSVTDDAGAQSVTFGAFALHLCPTTLQSAPTITQGKDVIAYLHRLARGLRERGLTLHKALGTYDASGSSSSLSLEELLQACSAGGLHLSRLEIERVFDTLAPRAPGFSSTRRMQLHDLEAHLQAAPDSLPEATWTKSLASQIASQAKKTGAVLEASLARLGQDAIDPEDLRKEFAKHAKMDAEQWATVVSYADKQFDGSVLWREFLRWSGVVKG